MPDDVSGHGDDGQIGIAAVGTQKTRRFMAIHDRHLDVHQDDRIVIWHLRSELVDGLPTVHRDIDLRAPTVEQLTGNLLVDGVILDQQDAHPIEGRCTPGQHQGKHLRRLVACLGRTLAKLSQQLGEQGLRHDIGHAGRNILLA